ncbi:VCBS repeat-containing protein [Glycomyces sp. NPDC049804]|uniref:FG-GAP repeat domain-containing protein n=1 Tax=Glycomyces sp. NPDC049804 TaxID=3154363 RepID=UPI0034271DE5
MNRIPLLRRRVAARIARATAVAVGAALIIPAGSAPAQAAEIDCAALGERPAASGMEAAFDAAAACDVEVRISGRVDPYTTMFATPDGLLHLAQTADPLQEFGTYASASPELRVWEGALTQKRSDWWVFLRYDDPERSLLTTSGATRLDWDGEIPVPSYERATAVYDELAAGVDLSAEAGVSSVSLRFTAADAAAWDLLASSLNPASTYGVKVINGGLQLAYDQYKGVTEAMTPFVLRGADGGLVPVEPIVGADGAFALNANAEALAAAEYPLALSTQWVIRDDTVNEWLTTTSAEPDTAVFRGEAGFEAPYFEAAGQGGSAVVGPYCDTLVDATCATEFQAATYWRFRGQLFGSLRPDRGYTFRYPIVSATFSVDPAEGTECVAPDLMRFSEGSPGPDTTSTWNSSKPFKPEFVASGSCQDGTATYDATSATRLMNHWTSSFTDTVLGMTGSDTTARFDGGSARFDIYLSALGYKYAAPADFCGTGYLTPEFTNDSTPSYGGFTFDVWRPDLFDHELSWTASFESTGSSTTEFRSAAQPLADGLNPVLSVGDHDAVKDSHYYVGYAFTSGTTTFKEYEGCYLQVDASAPKFASVDVSDPGLNYVGDTVSVKVSVSDRGFPDDLELNQLTVKCWGEGVCPAASSVTLTDTTSAWFTLKFTDTAKAAFSITDSAGNVAYSEEVSVTRSRNDFNGDGHQDLMAVRKSDGQMVFYPGNGDGTFGTGVSRGSGWGDIDAVMSGDLNGDGKADLLCRDNKTGYLWLYPGNGSGGWGTRIKVASGWNAMGTFTSGGDFNGDGKTDLLAVKKSDSKLYLYPGNGTGGFGTAKALGSGWNVFDALTSPGDIDNDGYDDLLARDVRNGGYYLYPGNSAGSFGTRIAVPANLDGTGNDRFRQVSGVGDLDGDGFEDLLAIDSRTGERELHSLATGGTARHEGIVSAGGWGGIRLPAPVRDSAFDYSGDGITDVIVADKNSALGPARVIGDGNGGISATLNFEASFGAWNLLESAGDLTGDGKADLLVRNGAGDLHVHPGNGTGAFASPSVKIGSGWNAFSVITGGSDYNGDGKTDIVARETSTGSLWLYPGKGDGTLGARVLIGNGWNAMREIEVTGDLDHDGHADMLAIRNSDACLYFYGGKGNGTFKPMAKIGCGWGAMDAVTGVGDFNRDGHADWMSRRKSDGALFFYPGNGAGNHTASKMIGTGWNAMTIA